MTLDGLKGFLTSISRQHAITLSRLDKLQEKLDEAKEEEDGD